MILDTAGWAHYAAGDYEAAAARLGQAAALMNETPTSDNEIIQHLLAAYESGGMDSEAIDLLAGVVALSVDPEDPARGQLASLLTRRDGSADAMEALIADRRYQGIKEAPNFTLPNRAGDPVELASLRGDVLLVCFWSYG